MIGEKFVMAIWRLLPEIAISTVGMAICGWMITAGVWRLVPIVASIALVSKSLERRGYCKEHSERFLLAVTLQACAIFPGYILSMFLAETTFSGQEFDAFIWGIGMEFAAFAMIVYPLALGSFLFYYYTGRLAKPEKPAS